MLAFAPMKRFVSLASLRCLCLMGLCLTCLCLAACQTGPSHIPPMPQLPAAALGSMIENSRYEGRRRGVKTSSEPHVDVILTEADLGGGTQFNMTCKLARVTPDQCAELAQQISTDAHIYKRAIPQRKPKNSQSPLWFMGIRGAV